MHYVMHKMSKFSGGEPPYPPKMQSIFSELLLLMQVMQAECPPQILKFFGLEENLPHPNIQYFILKNSI